MSRNVAKNKLTPRQQRAIVALLAGGTREDAAAAAGLKNRKTIERWLDQEAFATELQQRSQETVHEASTRLAGTLDMAVTTMREIMEDLGQPASVRLRAANYAATHALKLLEVSEVLRRLDELELAVAMKT